MLEWSAWVGSEMDRSLKGPAHHASLLSLPGGQADQASR